MLWIVVGPAAVGTALTLPEVTVNDGVVLGAMQTTLGLNIAAFRGIPYAEPPLGWAGRWQPPRYPVNSFHSLRACVFLYCARVSLFWRRLHGLARTMRRTIALSVIK
jgi:hypothetical protein